MFNPASCPLSRPWYIPPPPTASSTPTSSYLKKTIKNQCPNSPLPPRRTANLRHVAHPHRRGICSVLAPVWVRHGASPFPARSPRPPWLSRDLSSPRHLVAVAGRRAGEDIDGPRRPHYPTAAARVRFPRGDRAVGVPPLPPRWRSDPPREAPCGAVRAAGGSVSRRWCREGGVVVGP